ncbi:Molybdopterin-binding domain of aldehyde dehydrogenase-domain-containing protein, partial [Blyttiomyces helicus]
PTTVIAKKASALPVGQEWNDELVESIQRTLLEDMPMSASAPGGMVEYRKALACSFVKKFSLHLAAEVPAVAALADSTAFARAKSAVNEIERPLSSALQDYSESSEPGVVGKNLVHASALKQVTGEAAYIDDIPGIQGELYGVIVGSTEAHAYIESVDASLALASPGVHGFFTAKDIPEYESRLAKDPANNPNLIGPIFRDEELFATKEVLTVGQMIGYVVAETEEKARAAAALVKVTYKKLPHVLTIEEAIETQSFFDQTIKIVTGAFDEKWDRSPIVPLETATHTVQGRARISAQEHFYLETNACLVIPKPEDDEIEIFVSSQDPTSTQILIAHVMGIPSNRVVCRVKRMGGGFGGKASRPVFLAAAAAVASRALGKPVRSMLTREEDMVMTGMRHPYLGDYKVGFTDEGRLISLDLEIYANAGYSNDLSLPVLERACTHSDNTYKIPNVRVNGRLCKTNLATNTAFRGFGGPQGMMIAEKWITHVADYLGKPVEQIRELNFYANGEKTYIDMPLEDYHFDRVWKEVITTSDY